MTGRIVNRRQSNDPGEIENWPNKQLKTSVTGRLTMNHLSHNYVKFIPTARTRLKHYRLSMQLIV